MKKTSQNKHIMLTIRNIKSLFTFITYKLPETSVIYRLIFSLLKTTKKLHSVLLITQFQNKKVSECNQFVKPQYLEWLLTPF